MDIVLAEYAIKALTAASATTNDTLRAEALLKTMRSTTQEKNSLF
jgi:hypothetical protein